MMARYAQTVGLLATAAAAGAVLLSLVVPGCTQNQDNSPISINNSQGRPSLSVACSMDGSIAYVTDGRNVYRYDRGAGGQTESWKCILSQGQRQDLAIQYDSREQPSVPNR
jgi:hypothetical protein